MLQTGATPLKKAGKVHMGQGGRVNRKKCWNFKREQSTHGSTGENSVNIFMWKPYIKYLRKQYLIYRAERFPVNFIFTTSVTIHFLILF